MDEAKVKSLGTPSIKLEGLQIWVHGRQFPDSNDYWDGNWLNVTVHCGAAGASVWANGSIVHLGEIDRWNSASQEIQKTLNGEAKLDCMEPNLSVILKATRLGHIKMEVSITPDHMTQHHSFQFEVDQSYLTSLIKECSAIMEEYPIKGKPV